MALGVISNLFGNVAVAARSEPGGGGGEGARSGSGSSCGSEDALDIHVPSAHIDLSHTELDEGHFSQERSGSPISVSNPHPPQRARSRSCRRRPLPRAADYAAKGPQRQP